MSWNITRADEYGDLELDDPSGYLLDTDATGSKFSLFHSITSHRLPPGINSTSGEEDEDSGIDVAGVAGKLATFSSLAIGHLHPAIKQKHAAHEEYADLENIRANEIILVGTSSSQQVSLDDWNIGQSVPQQSDQGLHGSKPSSGGLKSQNSGGGLKRAMTMPGSLKDMVSSTDQSEGLIVLKDKLKAVESEAKSTEYEAPESSGISFSLGGEGASTPEAKPVVVEDHRGIKSPETDLDKPKPSLGGLSRCKTTPGSLARLHEEEEDDEFSEAKHSKEFSKAEASSQEAPVAHFMPTPSEAPHYRSTILSHFFARQSPKPFTIKEEDNTDSVPPIAAGSLTEKASQFSTNAVETLTKKKTKVRRRDLNMWAPGGT